MVLGVNGVEPLEGSVYVPSCPKKIGGEVAVQECMVKRVCARNWSRWVPLSVVIVRSFLMK